jgi:hypothetical protein
MVPLVREPREISGGCRTIGIKGSPSREEYAEPEDLEP